ncbi:MAG: hypothetical protein RR778_16180 [Glutamicibacter sp.]|uniref:hypothetical protein n=1 Tax=Glutamicibacter sp. TaxID=1931995 RepID=UPI002FC78BD9
MKKISKAIIAMVAGWAMLFAVASPVNASESSFSTNGPLSDSTVERAIAIAEPSFDAQLRNGAEVDIKQANVARINGSSSLMVAVATSGDGHDEGSFAVAVVDAAGDVVQSFAQVQATYTSDSTAEVKQWVDGSLLKQWTVEATPEAEAQAAKALSAMSPEGSSVGVAAAGNEGVIKCLNALGISTMAALVIISTCAAFCAVTVGTGCIICVAGFTAVAGASVGQCLSGAS